MPKRAVTGQHPANESMNSGTAAMPSSDELHEEFTVLQCEGMLPLPPRVQEAAGLREGSLMHMTIADDGILIRGGRSSDSSRRWSQARKRLLKLQDGARRQRAAKGSRIFYTLEEFFEALEQATAEEAAV